MNVSENKNSIGSPVDPSDNGQVNSIKESTAEEPSLQSVYRHIIYGLSIPERTLRSTSAMLGGVLRESTQLIVPQAFRTSRSYSTFVQQGLDFMSVNVGGVVADESDDNSLTQVEGYVARKTVGNFVELAGMTTLHMSPLTLLAVLSDVAYGSTSFLRELSEELKREGIIPQDTAIDSTADFLDAISNASAVTAQAFDMPPLSVDGLQETVAQTREAVAKVDPSQLIPKHELQRIWDDMKSVAAKENVSLFDVSSALTLYSLNQLSTAGRGAMSTMRVMGNMFDQHVIDHYKSGIRDIQSRGLYASLAESSQPYIDAVWLNFSNERPTLTEDLMTGRMLGRAWTGMRGWFSSESKESQSPAPEGGTTIEGPSEESSQRRDS